MAFTKFLPYQIEYINDKSRFKIVEKARRTGFTFAQAYEDVEYVLEERGRRVWFSSRDDSAAREYIDYCEFFIRKTFGVVAEHSGIELIDPDKDITAHVVRLKNGSKISAMTSSPGRFRSKGGKVVMDEFGFHDKQDELYAAALPVVLRNDPLRILSTYNGKSNLYYRLVQKVKHGELDWSLHTVDIFKAVSQGLYDSIMGRVTTKEERHQWLEELRKNCASEETWLQEFCCQPIDAATAFLTYDLIASCEYPKDEIFQPLSKINEKELFVGIDIGRRNDLTVIWVVEKTPTALITRKVTELSKLKFSQQRQMIFLILGMVGVRRVCIDETGLGMQLAEEAEEEFGRYKVEKVTFTGKVKEDMAYRTKRTFEDRRIQIPEDVKVREDLHNIQRLVTAAGNIRFNGERTKDGHSDRFWALSLALLAADDHNSGPIEIRSSGRRESIAMLENY